MYPHVKRHRIEKGVRNAPLTSLPIAACGCVSEKCTSFQEGSLPDDQQP